MGCGEGEKGVGRAGKAIAVARLLVVLVLVLVA